MKVLYDPDCLLHNPPHEILSGNLVPYLESPDRLSRIKQVLDSRGFEIVQSCHAGDPAWPMEHILKVHDPQYVRYLETIYDEWVEEGGDKSAVLPETFLHPKLSLVAPHDTNTISAIAKAGLYCFDLSCPITSDTFRSVIASVSVTLSAAETLVSECALSSTYGIFALARPPGHHAGTSVCGGYCFLNNVAVAARFLQTQSPGATVAVLDIDYHHGNGTQQIFYSDPSVLYVSLHAENDYPYYTGSSAERGSGPGEGLNANFPLPRGITTDDLYCATLTEAAARIRNNDPVYLIVSLGVDTYSEDPICEFLLTRRGYERIGAIIATIQKPTLFVMEGGYHLDTIGDNVAAVLSSFEAGPER